MSAGACNGCPSAPASASPGEHTVFRDAGRRYLRATGEVGSARRPAGRVTLVGAGPGGADLITLPGWQALHAADVVVTDRLSREAIVETVLAHARAGRRVVRLKGGDPFVFGRGGEEVLACARAGIPCMVVPGLSSVTSASTLAGIPVTHRGLTQSFTVLSGHLPLPAPREA